ncbi:polysaccharide deacetylase family protein [Streptacidiphilus sp. P02-A3a]|uniref:polysaccharide deacetylase family protein n=1 Tax=Streptacidiphilus sp. P02-A3a TaxID=2704468 RepID=UPI0015FC125F|nr:polysaccharide deacetylase family protein [Streptacidiphilus sp. P02-A3a]QMU70637.1 polysaccharide deacetylase family protein [Streptacidiphilus sp. P02-A3a]
MPRRLLFGAGGLALLGGCASADRTAGTRARTDGAVSGAAAATRAASPAAAGGRARSGDAAAVTAATAASGPVEPEHQVRAGPMTLALTFDDGPSPVYTDQVLALLRRHRVTATFFLIGENVRKYPDVVRRTLAAGHRVGNHTWSHPDLGRLSRTEVRTELERTSELIAEVGRAGPPSLFRAPGGYFTSAALEICAELGLRPVSWSVDPEDWSNPGTDAIVDQVLRQAGTGSIVLEHDGCLTSDLIAPGGPADRSQTVAALADYLPRLLDAGYHFAAV